MGVKYNISYHKYLFSIVVVAVINKLVKIFYFRLTIINEIILYAYVPSKIEKSYFDNIICQTHNQSYFQPIKAIRIKLICG